MSRGQATGRLLHHDPASRAYAAPRREVIQRSWRHRMGPVTDQADYNGCVGWTWLDLLNSPLMAANRRRWNASHTPARFTTTYLRNDVGLEIYKLATRNDPFSWTYPPTDGGSSGLGGAKALKAAGIIDAYRWTFSFDQLLAWGVRQPLAIGTIWTDPMSDPDREGIIHIGTDAQLKAANDHGIGHEYSLIGVNWPRKLGRIRNHWTESWGLDGEAWIPLDELERLVMDFQGDVCVAELAGP
ncbi:peptidase [Mycobacterium phage Quesadilla]|uniref:Cysteine protease n=1 Tax=Mycobacterium phage Quesadilla TaxID=2664226 RepID=A0A5Q2WC34_9CAUD|nr:peptidase [Mycobacterium phage Quesadilla]QGH75322.1 cysteine protease [Mycobacterium phage Quesadilla]